MSTHVYTLVAGALALALAGGSVAKELYRWTDEKGVTHYSDTKPVGVEFERRAIDEAPVATEPSDDVAGESDADTTTGDDESQQDGSASSSSSSAAAKPPAQVTPDCLLARSNVETLQNAPDVSMDTDGDGEPEVLDAEAREQAIVSAEELVRVHCGS